MRQRGDSGIQSAEHIKNKEQHAGRRYQVWNQHGRRYGTRLWATITDLPVDNFAAAQHLVVGVLLHGRPAKSETHRLEDRANQTINHAYGIMERIDRTSGKIIKLDADRSPEDVPAAVEPRRGLQEAVLRPRVPVRRPGRRRRRLHLHQVLHLFSDEKEGSQREESRVPIPLPRGLSKMCMLLRSNAPRPSSPLRYVRAER